MYDFFTNAFSYTWVISKMMLRSIIDVFAPGQIGFPLILLGAVIIASYFGSRFLQARKLCRTARFVVRTANVLSFLLICWTFIHAVQTIYPLAVKAFSSFQ